MTSYSLYPQITFPTRFNRTNGTLIGKCFCKLNKSILERKAGIFTNTFSDHQLYFLIMDFDIKTKLPPKFVSVNVQHNVAMHSVKNEINSDEMYNKLKKCPKADPNLNYSIIHEEIMRAKDKHMPIKIMKYNKYKHKHSKWITCGLLNSIKYRDSLYKKYKTV